MKKFLSKILAVCCCLLITLLVNCSQDEEPVPALVISNLNLGNSTIIITPLLTFDVYGSIDYKGAQDGVSSLRLTSSTGIDLTVPVIGVQLESGQVIGVFTFGMISVPGTYSFTVWIIDGSGRSSNKLTGSIEMIDDPNKRPTPVVLESVTWDNTSKSPLLSWTKNNDSDFYAYSIIRHLGETTSEVSRILDQNISSALDPENHGTVGFSYSYTVSVSNEKFSTESNSITFDYPPVLQLSNTLKPVERPILSSSGDVMYFINDESYYGHTPTLKAVSTQSNTVVRSLDLHVSSPYMPLAISKDDSKLYTVFEDSLVVFDATNFNVLMKTHLDFFGRRIACGRTDRLYMVTYAPASVKGHVKILDANSGAVVGDLGIADVQMESILISPDNNTLYGVGQPMNMGFPVGLLKIYKVDISSDITNLQLHREASNRVASIQLSSDAQTLYIDQQYFSPPYDRTVDAWSAATLQRVDQFNIPGITTFLINDNFLLATIDDPSKPYYAVAQYDLLGKSVLNSWEFLSPGLNHILTTHDQLFLYAFDANRKSWIIPLVQ